LVFFVNFLFEPGFDGFLGEGLRFGDRDFGERLFLGAVREAELKGLNTFTFFPLCFEVLCFFSPFIFLHLCRQCPHISFFGTDGWFNPNIQITKYDAHFLSIS
tara:strand:+ start:309 stop:617 length:309 start_codon:yes stop_codon:yes gene_type:complete